MHVLVTGGTGFVGNILVNLLCARNDRVVIVTRNPERARTARVGVSFERWLPDPSRFDAVVHLAGEPIAQKRWSAEQKRLIAASRVDTTRELVQTIGKSARRPKVLVCASAVGFYGDRGETLLTEASPAAGDFLGTLCAEWEAAARGAEAHGVRVVSPRIGIVLGRFGGVLAKAVPVFKLGVGGPIGPARSWFPWVHVHDLALFCLRAIDRDDLRGPYNLVAPGIVRQGEFARTLGRVLSRPAILPVPKLALKLALGEVANAICASQHVVPERTLSAGFVFEHATLEPALKNALQRS